jgi:heme/copper-type cytochrome/quinol oxidase subunit 3
MEIPFVVTPRRDTGLFNSKVGIWLFLASEVMLFGGLFSGYVFLRIGADYPWPERTLPVLPGLINTFVLIGSSVTVVFAWAALKMGNWARFRLFMGITIACAALFMVLKAVEYNVKFHHQAVRLHDYTVIEGHLGYELREGADRHHPKAEDYELDHRGHKIEENRIRVEASKLTFSTVRYHADWVEEMLSQAAHRKARIVLDADVAMVTGEGQSPVAVAKAGEELSNELLKKIRKAHLGARGHNAAMRTAALRKEWDDAKKAQPGKSRSELAKEVDIDAAALAKRLLTEMPSVTFRVEPPCRLEFKPRDIKEADGSSKLRDDTVVEGRLLDSPMGFHHVDAIDFRHLAMKAVEKGRDPMAEIERSWLIRNSAFAREAWEWHKGEVTKLEKELLDGYGIDERTGRPKREPTAKERYRIGWKEFAKKAEQEGKVKLGAFAKMMEEFKGPDYATRGEETFPHLDVPRDQIRFASKFTPAWNTYYAIYFTITGLHGLHVIGGALVLGYYLFFGRKMFETNPEWLANRVEVGGLFWHFVDLVWIFVFPIFYLM